MVSGSEDEDTRHFFASRLWMSYFNEYISKVIKAHRFALCFGKKKKKGKALAANF